MGNLIEKYRQLVPQLPEMHSVYLTTSQEERLSRLINRRASGIKLSLTDALLYRDFNKFIELDKLYKTKVINRFPDTWIVDTTDTTPHDCVKAILHEYNLTNGTEIVIK